MNDFIYSVFGVYGRRLGGVLALLLPLLFASNVALAHQQPTALVYLDINPDEVVMKVQVPLSELEIAFGHEVTRDPATLLERLSPEIKQYFTEHIRPVTDGRPWSVDVKDMKLATDYQDITVILNLVPSDGVPSRKFSLNYVVIM